MIRTTPRRSYNSSIKELEKILYVLYKMFVEKMKKISESEFTTTHYIFPDENGKWKRKVQKKPSYYNPPSNKNIHLAITCMAQKLLDAAIKEINETFPVIKKHEFNTIVQLIFFHATRNTDMIREVFYRISLYEEVHRNETIDIEELVRLTLTNQLNFLETYQNISKIKSKDYIKLRLFTNKFASIFYTDYIAVIKQ